MKIYKKRWIQSGIALICSLAIVLSVFPVLADNDEIENLENQSSSCEGLQEPERLPAVLCCLRTGQILHI